MPSKWIEHIKAFAAKNNLSYGCALSDPQCRATYTPVKKPATQKKEEKQKQKKIITQPMEIAEPTFLDEFIKRNEKFRGTDIEGIIQEQYELINSLSGRYNDLNFKEPIKDKEFIKEYLTRGRGVADTDESKDYFIGRVLRLFRLDADGFPIYDSKSTPLKAILKSKYVRDTLDKIKILQDYKEKKRKK